MENGTQVHHDRWHTYCSCLPLWTLNVTVHCMIFLPFYERMTAQLVLWISIMWNKWNFYKSIVKLVPRTDFSFFFFIRMNTCSKTWAGSTLGWKYLRMIGHEISNTKWIKLASSCRAEHSLGCASNLFEPVQLSTCCRVERMSPYPRQIGTQVYICVYEDVLG